MANGKYNIEDNKLNLGEALVSTPNNFSGELNVRRNEGSAKDGVFVRDDTTLESILVQHLKSDTPPEKIREVINAFKGLKVQDADTIYDKLKDLGIKTYVDIGISLNSLALALLPYLAN